MNEVYLMDAGEGFLAHFGVKGMKWGVRKKYTPKDRDKAHRKEAAKNYGKYFDDSFDRRFGERDVKSYTTDDKKIVLKKGSELYRTQRSGKNDQTDSHRYVSTNRKDADRYISTLPGGRGGQKRYKSGWHEVSYKTTRDLVAPSDKEAYEIFKSIKNQEIGKTRFLKRSVTVDKQLRKQALSNKDADKYEAFLASQWKHTPVNSAYFKAVRKAGYNAVQDLNDRGIVSDRPMIALDPKGTMRETGRRTLDAWAINEAQRKVKRIGHAMHDDVNYLEHFGVKGMKWGVRKAKSAVSSARSKHQARKAARHPQSPEAARAHALRKQVKKKGLDSLSNSELQALNNRLNLEANYRNAMKQHPDTLRSKRNRELVTAGAKIVGPIVAKSVGKEFAKSSDPRVKLAGSLLTDDISVSKLVGGLKGKKKK
nr:MAG TPA: Structural protein [Caudoviricetes sp.]